MHRILVVTILFTLVGCTAPNQRPTVPSKRLIKGPYEISNPMVKIKTMPPLLLYPTKAKAERIQGDVVVSVTIDKNGNTTSTKPVDGPPELMAYAESLLLQMKFTPFVVNGQPTETTFLFTMPFRLR